MDQKRTFWDVSHKDHTIVATLDNEDYDQLIIDVDDPHAVINMLLDKES